MELGDDGFYSPIVEKDLSKAESKMISRLCPGIHVDCEHAGGVWGAVESIEEAWANDSTIRHKAASGGAVTAIGCDKW